MEDAACAFPRITSLFSSYRNTWNDTDSLPHRIDTVARFSFAGMNCEISGSSGSGLLALSIRFRDFAARMFANLRLIRPFPRVSCSDFILMSRLMYGCIFPLPAGGQQSHPRRPLRDSARSVNRPAIRGHPSGLASRRCGESGTSDYAPRTP